MVCISRCERESTRFDSGRSPQQVAHMVELADTPRSERGAHWCMQVRILLWAPPFKSPIRLAVRTLPFQGSNARFDSGMGYQICRFS